MSLLEKMKKDHMKGRIERNATLTNLLGTVISECETMGKSPKIAGRPLTDDEVLAVVQKTRNKIVETIALIETDEARVDQKTKLVQESEYLFGYLPKQLTREEIEKIAIQQEVLNQNLGQIMGYLKKNYNGRYDAKQAHEIIREVVGFEQR